ncbi:MAG: hypothetical protein KDM63_21855, partial [Verrucomicrobiae bacterium]|nr:hypothetical protein [Verrucomicrobiae bacterium]
MSEDPSQAPSSAPVTEEELSSLLAFRRQKLDRLRELGVDPFGGTFETTHEPGALRADFAEGLQVKVAGRITALRDMGKTNFIDL